MGGTKPHPSTKQVSKTKDHQGSGTRRSAAINNNKNGRTGRQPSTSSCNETKKANTGPSSSSSPGESAAANNNRPRNWLLQDATSDVAFTFDVAPTTKNQRSTQKGGSSSNRSPTCELRVQQTAHEDMWPGGALWDSGVLLAQLMAVLPLEVEMAFSSRKSTTIRSDRDSPPPRTVTIACTHRNGSGRETADTVHHRHAIRVPSRLHDCVGVVNKVTGHEVGFTSPSSVPSSRPSPRKLSSMPKRRRPITILELGCGVGLTGMVAAVSMRATLTVLTDLPVVIENVTQPNLKRNERILRQHGAGIVRAVSLTWGCHDDERHVQQLLRSELDRDGGAGPPCDSFDWILVGDVAYQHRPGAPSHFDDLLSTLLRFTEPPAPSPSHPDGDRYDEELTSSFTTPIVVFATRIRMPASVDLLHMLLEHFDPMVDPPLEAHEINGASIFGHVKHNTPPCTFSGERNPP